MLGGDKMATRTNIYLSDLQLKKLKSLAKRTDLSLAEHVRRAVDQYLTQLEKKEK
jgi:hypothetical protein